MQFPLTINDQEFRVQFRADLVSANDAARQFCLKESQSVGVTSETIMNCINPVKSYILDKIQQWVTSRTIKVSQFSNVD